MATKTQDMTKLFQDAFVGLPFDQSAFQEAFKNQAAFGEKLTKVALEAAEKSAEISSKWTKEAIARLGDAAKAKAEPADYGKSLTDLASASAEIAAENLAAFAEVAKKVQMETVELVLAAGKDFSEDATAAVKKATTEATAAVKKATDEATAATKKATAATN